MGPGIVLAPSPGRLPPPPGRLPPSPGRLPPSPELFLPLPEQLLPPHLAVGLPSESRRVRSEEIDRGSHFFRN
jgi:hypothetical protein